MNLIIVESPTKAKTITKFVGKDFVVESSFGHIRDLPKSTLGVDTENNFEPKYVIPTKARKTVTNLKKLAAKADKIILASDEDREGEAISWHLIEALGLENGKARIVKTKRKSKAKTAKDDVRIESGSNTQKIERIVFHEITKDAILAALEHPRDLDMNLVNAQQARRVLDRLVGYELSPFLWKKVAKGLSAGRVQSVAVRLIVEREREIQKFKPDEYWDVSAELETGKKEKITARLYKENNKTLDKLAIKNDEQAQIILGALNGATYEVASVEQHDGKKNVPSPFTTSTLQQAANRMLGMSAKQTMTIAQKLYEFGFITYMRTDSFNLSDKFLTEAKSYLTENLGVNYALNEPRKFKTKSKGAQEAHEAIRPTEAANTPEMLAGKLDGGQLRLYKLIWQRSLATQMPEAIISNTTIDIDAKNTKYQFRVTGQVLKFAGYLKIYPEKTQDVELPQVAAGELLDLLKLEKMQHFTKPPARYSDAGLVKILERFGIGRPSTYAPTIATIESRNYVSRDEGKKLMPNEIAFTVIDLLLEHFPEIVDYQFTAKMENGFDEIAAGSIKWQPMIKDFYSPFHANLTAKYEEVQKSDINPDAETKEICDKCGSPMIIKTGRFGKFLACSNFPACRNIKSMNSDGTAKEKTEQQKELEEKYKDEVCDKCGSPMVLKSGRFGPFLACSSYPKCKNIKNIKENGSGTGITCPVCTEGEIVMKRSRRGSFYACNRYPDCKTSFSSKPTGEKCPDCSSLLVEAKDGGVKCSNKTCEYKKEGSVNAEQ
jgi:DNA topoisomerase-1